MIITTPRSALPASRIPIYLCPLGYMEKISYRPGLEFSAPVPGSHCPAADNSGDGIQLEEALFYDAWEFVLTCVMETLHLLDSGVASISE